MPVQTRAQRRAESAAPKISKSAVPRSRRRQPTAEDAPSHAPISRARASKAAKSSNPSNKKRKRTKTEESYECKEREHSEEGTPKKRKRVRARRRPTRSSTLSKLKAAGPPQEEEKSEGNSSSESTPKKKGKSAGKKKLSPSKELAHCVDRLRLRESEEKEKETEDGGEVRYQRIMALQERLLTVDETAQSLLGREGEFERISSFIEERLKQRQGGSFYLCGSPGTGKTATMRSITAKFADSLCVVKLNGMSIETPSSIFNLLHGAVFDSDAAMKPLEAKNKMERFFVNKRRSRMHLVIIDEMDGLLTASRQQVLYHLFGWTQQKHCKLILFGIANSIDLTDRFLPRLKQRNFEPELLIFRPYTKSQLIRIIKQRLSSGSGGDYSEYFEDIAVTLCAQKVAKMYGDVRKCLELCREALSLLLTDNGGAEKIGFMAMKNVLSASFQSPLIDIIRDLPNHQKTILVIALMLVERQKEHEFVLYTKLETFYQFMAKKHILPKTSSREFNVIVDSLITDNIIRRVSKQKSRKKAMALANDTKLQICVSFDDIQFAFKDDSTLSKFFEMKPVIPGRFLS